MAASVANTRGVGMSMRTFHGSIIVLLCGNTSACVTQLDGFGEDSQGRAFPDGAVITPLNNTPSGSSESPCSNDVDAPCSASFEAGIGKHDGGASSGPCPVGSAYGVGPNAADTAVAFDANLGSTPEDPCRRCTAGEYCPGGAGPAQACSDGQWDEDADPATPCVAHAECAAGTRVRTAGSATQNVVCEGCASGTFSDAANAPECTQWTDCSVGQYVLSPGNATSDRVCAECESGESSDVTNAGACTKPGDCPAGTVQTIAATETTPPECEACARGTYCAGGVAEAAECAMGSFDDDADPATPCVSKSICVAGQWLVSEGSTTSDRTCELCSDETFSTEDNSVRCEPWRSCPPGTYVDESGTLTSDRVCAACPDDEFSASENAQSCTPHTTCAAPETYESEAPTATDDRQCAACTPPARTMEDNAAQCVQPAFQMSNGRAVIEAENHHAQVSNGATIGWSAAQKAGASEDACLQLGPDNGGLSWTSDVPTSAPRLDYYVNFTQTGTFFLFVRGAGENTSGNSDSCYAGMDGAFLEYRFDVLDDQWDWVGQPFTVTDTGIHTVSVWGREDGFFADKIVLQTSSTPPLGVGPPQSAEQ